ncbi:MAG: FAD-dependent thymidylate synthase [Candidatus Saganbacteria bacterium]|nr:FAD-dependent thymidylate synthase [Candidatus Saganbacteria bacterium]
MKVLLAGYNLDTDVIEEFKKTSKKREDITPETLSAAYARISRDPRPVDELRAIARAEVEKARKSNKNIIFAMGHHSVAEHAVFNFDIIGISRLAIEALEHFRLSAYTEKSQRYIKLENDYVLPEEIAGGEFEGPFKKTIQLQNEFYHRLFDRLNEYFFEKHKDMAKDTKNHKTIEGYAKEDARYIAALATQGQLGETINARNLELLIRRFASHELAEVRDIGRKMYEVAHKISPSIILFTSANDYDQRTYRQLKEFVGINRNRGKGKRKRETVELEEFTKNADDIVVASFLHTSSELPYNECRKAAAGMTGAKKKEIIKKALQYMELYDSVPREFEYVNLTYDLIVSAACFGQLKRHRLASITSQSYDPQLGVTVPESVKAVKMDKEFMGIINKTDEVYYKIAGEMPGIAQYILTNAHRKRVLLRVDARELYHISRLREDPAAQWDIREAAHEMSALARKAMPLTMMLLGGKDLYPEIYKKVYGHLPKVVQAELPKE